MHTAMSIAGSDPSGGAGIQADLKTFHAHGVYGLSVVTAVTVQNTQKVYTVHQVPPEIVKGQIEVLLKETKINALKIGMLYTRESIQALVSVLDKWEFPYVVLDPVFYSGSGYALLREEARQAMLQELLPRVHLLTPNIFEASFLSGLNIGGPVEMQEAARRIKKMGPQGIVIKGGHLPGQSCVDVYYDGYSLHEYRDEYLQDKNPHGTGCTLAAAITSNLALGYGYPEAISRAKEYIHKAIANALHLGSGPGVCNHFYNK